MIRAVGPLVLVLPLLLLAAGCATDPSARSRPETGGSPRTHCLSDPRREAGETNRPLFFLFCVESP